MSDSFSPIPLKQMLKLILAEEKEGCIFGIDKEFIFTPLTSDGFASKRFGKDLHTPIGVAAGPQTQLSQNIIMSWLTGARYIELKTVQTLDELEVAKPCIDMQDEGYNVEWSQELKLKDSFNEYLNAWILIHILSDKFGFPGIGTIFNMSVGYNLSGIMEENVQQFFTNMKDCSVYKAQKLEEIKEIYPRVLDIDIPNCISDNITLSTMHGCPANEIEQIAAYLIEEKKFHTLVKLNPTLIGDTNLRGILNDTLHFTSHIPDLAFEHDLKYIDAVNIIKSLRNKALQHNVFFGLKLTNTLEAVNIKDIFDKTNEMMYLSGRALHPISVNLAAKLQTEFDGELHISFSGGADAFNTPALIGAGLQPVTVSSDLLKPGGYARLAQYIKNLREAFSSVKATSLQDFVEKNCKEKCEKKKDFALQNLISYAQTTLTNERYKKEGFSEPSIKTGRKLMEFDCIAAPCQTTCPTEQDIPQYMYHVSRGEFDKAFDVILDTNPFPNSTGMVCDHQCQTKCTRINYDNPLLIREIKSFVAHNHASEILPEIKKLNGLKVSVIGAGPAGLSCAYYLARAGFLVNVYEAKSKAGGMVASAIPPFRISSADYESDILRIEKVGVKIHYNNKVDKNLFRQLQANNDFVFFAAGAQSARQVRTNGFLNTGVLNPLEFLNCVRTNKNTGLGENIVIMGGGNTAMDVARTANRLVENSGKVTLIYRRSKAQMPAEYQEVKALVDEGIQVLELVDILEIKTTNERVSSAICCRMELGEKDGTGRQKPHKIDNSEFELEFDTLIPAIGQDLAIDFIDADLLITKENSFETQIENLFIGGDAARGAATLIKAIADGRKTASEIITKAEKQKGVSFLKIRKDISIKELRLKKAVKIYGMKTPETALQNRKNFNLVVTPLSEEQAQKEATRCLLCDELCDICTTVCPNAANYAYHIEPKTFNLEKAVLKGETIKFEFDKTLEIKQPNQVLNIGNWCNECGNCTTFCPSAGAPYLDKPKFYFTKEDLDREKKGYYIEVSKDEKKIFKKHEGEIVELSKKENFYVFKTKSFSAKLAANNFSVIDFTSNQETGIFTFENAAKMSLLLEGALPLYDI